MSRAEQLSLFVGDGSRAAEWRALFERREVAWKGITGIRGWRCPSCGAVEVNEFQLVVRHELDPDRPQDGPPVCKVTRDRDTGGSEIPRGGERDELRSGER